MAPGANISGKIRIGTGNFKKSTGWSPEFFRKDPGATGILRIGNPPGSISCENPLNSGESFKEISFPASWNRYFSSDRN
jgi:hypothetical protein